MITFEKAAKFIGEIEVPSDKSITHRALILGSMSEGVTLINKPLLSTDTLATLHAFEFIGVDVMNEITRFTVRSDGYKRFKEPLNVINCMNSGTTTRLLAGVLSASKYTSILTGDASLINRPMGRVIKPLSKMGADIRARDDNNFLPMTIHPSKMFSATIESEVNSAQVKSAVLLAGLQLEGETTYIEKVVTRDHTENMLRRFGADLSVDGDNITVKGTESLAAQSFTVPGDFSSAAYYIALALIFEGSVITVKDVGLNKTRTGLLTLLQSLGVVIDIDMKDDEFEPYGDIRIKHQKLKGGTVTGDIIANIIDEIPVLAVSALFGEAPIEIRNAKELRVKESDRISAIVSNFKALGAKIEEFDDGMKIYPLEKINKGVKLKSYHDHRIAMINIILAKKFGVDILLDDINCLDVSYPEFIVDIMNLEEV